jgi:hypothetical protein
MLIYIYIYTYYRCNKYIYNFTILLYEEMQQTRTPSADDVCLRGGSESNRCTLTGLDP